MGHVCLKARSLGQILEKLYERSRGHIFNPMIMKLGQNVCLNEISDEFESGSCHVKNYVTRSDVRKPSVSCRGHIFSPILIRLKMDHVGSKTRSLGQMLEKPCVCSRGYIFSPIIMKLGQNVCLDEISDKFKMGHVRSRTRSLGQMLEKLMYALEATFQFNNHEI